MISRKKTELNNGPFLLWKSWSNEEINQNQEHSYNISVLVIPRFHFFIK